MSEPRFVLDASALLCLLYDEPGASRIEEILPDACIGATNLAEVIGKMVDRGQAPDDAVSDLRELALDVVPFDRAQGEAAGMMRQVTRGAGLSLGDRACLALAAHRGAIAVTTDRAWKRIQVGVRVEVARP